ncbi:FtsW/RodA/SpoVE family cell cycle protein [Candidatus Clostridium stratigraminis]|uniref:FtsW/RodA/SpoVE family cell cycle protein n=1 Tax=Candidatus Clostridium stratigraminis TaxID=3381661 RepID=A0ABW8T8G2_9CLOT
MSLNNNPLIKNYISEVCSLIKCREAHEDIALELENHIIETAEAYIEAGNNEEEALQKSISNMGDALLVGRDLNKVHKQRPDWPIIAISLVFSIFGLVCLYLLQTNELLSSGYSAILGKSLIFSFIGIAISIGLYFFDYRKLNNYSKYLYYASIFILIYLIFVGSPVNGVKQYLSISSLSINISSIVLLLFLISLSGIFYKLNWEDKKNLLYAFALFIIPNFLFVLLPSLTTCIIYSTVFLMLILASGAKIKHVVGVISPVIIIAYLFIFKEPFRFHRILGLLNWKSDPQGIGYINTQIDKLIYSSGIFGKGIFIQPVKLPNYQTDLILTYIIYTFGWTAFAVIVTLILIFIIRIINSTSTVADGYGKLILYGLAALFSSQFVLSIFMTLGIIVITGVSMPFISYGGTALVINFMEIGIISSIYRRKNLTNKVLAE